MWRETRIGLEAASLRRSPVFRGLGLPPGDRRPVLLIPGFMAGDASLGTMSQWLRRAGYCTHRTGIRANFDCSEEACKRLEARLEHMAERHDERVVIIGQSRGGVFARALGARRPDLVSAIVTLGSPTQSMLAVHPLVLAQIGLVSALGTAHLPGMFRVSCLRGKCCEHFRSAMTGPFPDDVGYVAVYSRSDGIVELALLPRPRGRRARRDQRLPLRHGRQRPGLPRRRQRARALRARRPAARSGHRRSG